ncbi:MAG: tRNA (guanosine(46)-N7)-methyltransferase TrmB [Rhodospirillales bacterium]|nr:tRNA (guanosine(46)-N7)-methyltransferase TrmB [Rhodospirillales bacterium]
MTCGAPSTLAEARTDQPADDLGAARFYGRRKGRRLRQGRQRLVEELLPRLAVPLPEPGVLLDPRRLFAAPVNDVWMEIGFGAGEHLLAQARQHPDVGFIGCEPYLNGIAALLPAIAEEGLDTVRIVPDDARLWLPALAPASLGRVFVLFPDPWPKARHHERRLVSPVTIRELARVLRPGAELRLASDHAGYIRWMLEHLTRETSPFGWLAARPSDWRARPADGFVTRYEEKALERGVPCVHLRFVRKEG